VKLFITGISGRFGANAALHARTRYQVSGCFDTQPFALDGVDACRVDLSSAADVAAAFDRIRPDVVLHAAGLTDVERCEREPDLARRVNVGMTATVAAAARTARARLVHVSSDHLFDGTRANVTEETPTSPLNTYGRTKRDAEQAVVAACPGALIVRTNFYGWGTAQRSSFSDWILHGLRAGAALTMFSDVYFTPILVNDAIDVVWELLNRGTQGIVHVGGAERISKHDFALQLADTFGLPHSHVTPLSIRDFDFQAIRPRDMSLSTAKAERLIGHAMPRVRDGLEKLLALERAGWPGELGRATAGTCRL